MSHLHPNEKRELEVQDTLNDCIEVFTSFKFNAGAGAGKTYALIETIKYIIKNKFKELEKRNQQVICITYTNVAVREIKERLGSSDVVLVSTIHDRLWDIIKPYRHELLKLHLEKLHSEIANISKELSASDRQELKRYVDLSENQKNEFNEFAFEHREVYFQNRDARSGEFRKAYENITNKPSSFDSLIRNYNYFKEILKVLYKKDRYEKCVNDIEKKKKVKVEYDNADRLEYMRFGHDTLLEYGLKLFERYPTLRRIMIDKYPFILVDEYQDTNDKVVKIIKILFDSAKKYKKKWLVGYFGDTAQNIYDDGVGIRIDSIHPEVFDVDKIFNRRSHKQIIDVANSVRNDSICQEPIFLERNQGKVSFCYSKNIDNKETLSINFLDQYKSDLIKSDNTDKKTIHCLVLTNRLMAELSRFKDIYNVVNNSSIFWKEVNAKLLSHDTEKLHPTIFILYKIIKLHMSLSSSISTYGDIFGSKKGRINGKITFLKAAGFCNSLKGIKSDKLDEFIKGVSVILADTSLDKDIHFNTLASLSIKINEIDEYGDLYSYVKSEARELMLGSGENSSQEESDKEKKIESLLGIELEQWYRWVDFIDRNNEGKDIVYHTYHGTKGEEYENVAILMEHSFGNRREGKDKFKNYFLKVSDSGEEKENEQKGFDKEFENTKNLVYVACSRAIKNLRVLYLNDIEEIKEGIEKIFGTAEMFSF